MSPNIPAFVASIRTRNSSWFLVMMKILSMAAVTFRLC